MGPGQQQCTCAQQSARLIKLLCLSSPLLLLCARLALMLLLLVQSAAGLTSGQIAYLTAMLRERNARHQSLLRDRVDLSRVLKVSSHFTALTACQSGLTDQLVCYTVSHSCVVVLLLQNTDRLMLAEL